MHDAVRSATQVVPVFAGGLDFSSPVKKFFYDPLGSGKNFVDTVISLTGLRTARHKAEPAHVCFTDNLSVKSPQCRCARSG